MAFAPAVKGEARLRMALEGPSGSGKTFTALKIASYLVPKGRIGLIDTEQGSSSWYAEEFDFVKVDLHDYSPEAYIQAIKEGDEEGLDILIIDSLTHAWAGEGGALDKVDNATRRSRSGNSFNAWREVTPVHNKMVDTILRAKAHIIATLRVKTEYIQQVDPRTGKTVPKKVGLKAIQREGLDYEFDVVGDMDLGNNLSIEKTRCPDLAQKIFEKPGKEFADILKAWITPSDPNAAPMAMREPIQEKADPTEALFERANSNGDMKALLQKLKKSRGAVLTLMESEPDDARVIELLTMELKDKEAADAKRKERSK